MLREELADVDDLVLCQLRNAWLELSRNATRERTQRKYIYAEPPKTQRSLQAATCAYWEQRAKNSLKNGLAKASAVQGFLAEVEDIQLLGKVWLLEVTWSQNPPKKEVISKLLNPDAEISIWGVQSKAKNLQASLQALLASCVESQW